jgi:DNA (cytosine-5)-methyltransferase 1
LVGGFPCQDYSVAKSLNSSRGIEGKKGVLWWEIIRLVEKRRPRFIFLENVDRLLKSPSAQRGRDFAIMLKTLGDLGYAIEWRLVNAADYGFPQRRVRVFIVARRLTRKAMFDPKVFLEKGILPSALPIRKQTTNHSEIDLSAPVQRISDDFNFGQPKSPFQNSGAYFNGRAYTMKSVARYSGQKKTLKDVLLSDSLVDQSFYVPEDQLASWEFLKGGKKIERIHKESGTIYTYSEGSISYPDPLDKPSRTILTGEGGVTPSRFKHVIQTNLGLRRLTPIELERLNGFPDDWTKFEVSGKELSDSRRAFFMGNALVVGLVSRVGNALSDSMRQE